MNPYGQIVSEPAAWLEQRAPDRLSFTWNVLQGDDEQSPYPESYVTFALRPDGDDVLLTLTHRPILNDFEAQTMMGWRRLLDALNALLRGEAPEPREIAMARNRARYGVEAIRT